MARIASLVALHPIAHDKAAGALTGPEPGQDASRLDGIFWPLLTVTCPSIGRR